MFPGPLRAFHETVRAGSIRKASEKLGLAPSSVSRQIAVLESLMGTPLFNRSLGGMGLTHAGTMVAEYAQSAVMEFDTLRLELNELRGTRGLVRVALVESIIPGGPVQAAAELRKSFDEVTVEFHVMPATEVVGSLVAKTTDIGISFCSEPRPEITCDARIVEPLMLVVHPDHPLAGAKSLGLGDLADVDLALPDWKFGVRRLLDRVAMAAEVSISPVITSNSFEALRAFARSGQGAAILPSRAIAGDAAHGALVGVPLAHPELNNTTLDLIRLRQRRMPRIVRHYLDALRTALSQPL